MPNALNRPLMGQPFQQPSFQQQNGGGFLSGIHQWRQQHPGSMNPQRQWNGGPQPPMYTHMPVPNPQMQQPKPPHNFGMAPPRPMQQGRPQNFGQPQGTFGGFRR